MRNVSLAEVRAIINNAFDNLECPETVSIEDYFQTPLIELSSDDIDCINSFLKITRSDWEIIQLNIDCRPDKASFALHNEPIGLDMTISFRANTLFLFVIPILMGLR